MTKGSKQTGDYGESLACEFLRKKSFKILERNFRIRGGEIDIIAQDPTGDLVFVEVKTRHTHEYGDPAEAVTPWKINFLIRASQFYVLKHNWQNKPLRIDVICVDFTKENFIEHLINVTG